MRTSGDTVALRTERALIRATDYIVALALIIFLLPMLIFVAIWTALRCGLPIIVREHVYGPEGQAITILRFRNADEAQSDLPSPERIDEITLLPRLFNVLAGDLSMVGSPIRPARGERKTALTRARPGLVTPSSDAPISYAAYWAALAKGAMAALRR
jgi:lipopolysaccharide/colanic/teichoic acid biosynthesis glycosyltransferase